MYTKSQASSMHASSYVSSITFHSFLEGSTEIRHQNIGRQFHNLISLGHMISLKDEGWLPGDIGYIHRHKMVNMMKLDDDDHW